MDSADTIVAYEVLVERCADGDRTLEERDMPAILHAAGKTPEQLSDDVAAIIEQRLSTKAAEPVKPTKKKPTK